MVMRPCLDCGALSCGSRCPTHQREHGAAREARRGTPAQRGLNSIYRRERDRLVAEATAAGVTHCPRCGRQITEKNMLTAEHGTARAHGGTEITGLICRSCNSSAGATVRKQSNPGGGS